MMKEPVKKIIEFKKKHVLIGLFSIAILGSGIAYSAVNQSEPKKEISSEQKKKKAQDNTISAWESKIEKKTEPNKKSKTKDSLAEYVETNEEQKVSKDFSYRENLVAQLNNAIITQENKELKRSNEQTILDAVVNKPIFKPISPVQPELPKEKPTIPVDKEDPAPNPIPEPIPDPAPDPNPNPDPNPEPPIIETDYSVLSTLTEQAVGIDLTLYLSSSVNQFKVELLISQRILEDRSSSQEIVDRQVVRLRAAIDNLIKKGNKKGLETSYSLSLMIQTDVLTDESTIALKEAQNHAKSVLDNPEVSQEQVDEAKNQLQVAIDNLKEKEEPNLSLVYLQRLVTEAADIDTTPYTIASVEIFTEKLAEVNVYIASNNITTEDNERLLLELQQAIEQLQLKADISKVSDLLTQIESLDRTKYTEESLKNLDEMCEVVSNQLGDSEITQEQVNSLYEELYQVFNQLEEIDLEKEIINE
ncbi:hypothetical protein IGK29_002843 [Enterococcus sp. AZ008]